MVLIYRILSNIFYPIIIIFIYFRKLIQKEDPERYKEKILLVILMLRKNYKKLIWFHAASMESLKVLCQ